MSTKINAAGMHYKDLNHLISSSADRDIVVDNVLGQRYIGSSSADKNIEVHGVPGNALGAYLNNCKINVFANAQDATGDTMNSGEIIIHGTCGDAAGYGMRDGKILIKGSAGYRAGIHMKEYQKHVPTLVIGEAVGAFLGEYQAGGRIIVLGIGHENECPVGGFCGTGMHGGAIYIRSEYAPKGLPVQVKCEDASADDIETIKSDVEEFSASFGSNAEELLKSHFFKLTPNTASPYKQLYVNN
ncbi:MAG: glutamate synthase [Oscillospiraceae bacterium]|nr:glutamate synthase [Oscillospiraceae bacterium]